MLRATGCLLVAVCSACSETPDRTGSVASDSSGVRIVLSDMPVWVAGTGWKLGGEPERTLATAETGAEAQLFGVADVALSSTGSVIVGNRGTAQLIVFDGGTGEPRTIGRRGGGPEEFTHVVRMFGCARDTLVVFEGARLGVLTVDGAFVRKIPMTRVTPVPRIVEGVSADCASALLLGGDVLNEPYPRGVFQQRLVLYWRSIDGEEADTVVRFGGPQRTAMDFGRLVVPTVLPFAARPTWFVHGDSVVFGTGGHPEYGVYARDGRLIRTVRWQADRLPVTSTDRSTFDRRRNDLGRTDPSAIRVVPEISRYQGIPDFRPVYDRLVVDDQGNTWVRRYPGYAGGMPNLFEAPDTLVRDSWWVFDPAGKLLGEIATPARLWIMRITASSVIGVWRDMLDVESIRIYPLVK